MKILYLFLLLNIIENINFDIEDLSKERRGLEEEIRDMKLGKIN